MELSHGHILVPSSPVVSSSCFIEGRGKNTYDYELSSGRARWPRNSLQVFGEVDVGRPLFSLRHHATSPLALYINYYVSYYLPSASRAAAPPLAIFPILLNIACLSWRVYLPSASA